MVNNVWRSGPKLRGSVSGIEVSRIIQWDWLDNRLHQRFILIVQFLLWCTIGTSLRYIVTIRCPASYITLYLYKNSLFFSHHQNRNFVTNDRKLQYRDIWWWRCADYFKSEILHSQIKFYYYWNYKIMKCHAINIWIVSRLVYVSLDDAHNFRTTSLGRWQNYL